ncbi:MAG: hypothetical protein ABIN89_15735 [Chitinophagaceae bacterium]
MKKNFFQIHAIRIAILLSLAFQTFPNQPLRAQSTILQNELIAVSFNDQGMSSFTDKQLHKTFSFSSDQFLITLSGNAYTNKDAQSLGSASTSTRLTYTYKIPGFTLKLNYSLEKDCFFLSKQLEIYADKDDVFRVGQLKLWNVQFAEKPASYYVPHTRRPELKTNDYGAFFRFVDATGLLMTIQNPFLQFKMEQESASLDYHPDMGWKKEYGPFQSDMANMGAYALTGDRIPAKMIPEWKWTQGIVAITDEEQDRAEVDAFTKIVAYYVQSNRQKSIKMNVGWCENDYQVDISKASGRSEYKRIIDQTAAMGMDHILFTPSNASLGSREDASDDWGWENLLWLNLGIKIRKGEWNVEKDPIPASVQEMLDYAKSKKVSLISYLYPVLPFAGNPEWIVEGSSFHKNKRHASLGVRSFQDYLIRVLGIFYERTGISGYSYDYTYLWYEGTSRYEQWWGWRRVKESLRKKYPGIIIDGRQLDQLYGPWSWLANNFPHPTAEDEQPESFKPFPDLHFDRVSADRQRYTAYRYRVDDYCPPTLMPGFMFHQTSRFDVKDGKVFLPLEGFRRRDWDYLGWKYSLFSSIATGGLNNVVNMIPARDMEEYKNFLEPDKKFVREWLNWTDSNREYLLQTRFILGQPALGKVDGTSAINGNKGYIFLFNPNARRLPAEFLLNSSIGLDEPGNYNIKILYPGDGHQLSSSGNDVYWKRGDLFRLEMDGASVVVLSITPREETSKSPHLFNLAGNPRLSGTTLYLDAVAGEKGFPVNWKVYLNENKKLDKVLINGKQVSFSQHAKLVTGTIRFDGKPFLPMQQAGNYEPDFTGGVFKTSFSIPAWVKEQLLERKKKWPIPWTKEDYKTTWLAPERLLLFVQVAEPADTMKVSMRLNGKPVELIKAYSSVRPNPQSFVGWYCDVSDLGSEEVHSVELILPLLGQGQFQGLFFENIEKKLTSQFTF